MTDVGALDRVELDGAALGINPLLTGDEVIGAYGKIVEGTRMLDFENGDVLVFDGLNDWAVISDEIDLV